ncbi:endonuclease/exonuclease/phosphatase family protein [Crassaminicella thermophila]|uniref:Endonuclease/exonuclease/phosphatase family protein n=1 Tax=Crassaminicella thermophila TaxID=2599308 RepID=A0A5C0SEZ5_CRATE|nr:endonuclease/exonuclease/phosphatase family protein [Crassaminicella thermophila]QEK11874.1 endonuclease/exonuclease/phosphatase family protein [Crassaminicella thermophila]
MKLLTLNCHSWMEDRQEEKIKIIANTIKEERYDVVALQEVNQSINREYIFQNIKKDNFAFILLKELESLGCMEYRMLWDFSHIGFDKYEEGVSILTKHKIEKYDSFFITKSQDQAFWKTRKIVGATIKINEEVIDFYSCHLGWWLDEEEPFKYQVDQLLSTMKKDRLTFFMGDFNNDAFVEGEGYDYLIEKGLYDTFSMAKENDSGITVKGKIAGWSSNEQDLRLDLILSNKKIDIKYSKVIFNGTNKPIVSDHYGVEIETEGF